MIDFPFKKYSHFFIQIFTAHLLVNPVVLVCFPQVFAVVAKKCMKIMFTPVVFLIEKVRTFNEGTFFPKAVILLDTSIRIHRVHEPKGIIDPLWTNRPHPFSVTPALDTEYFLILEILSDEDIINN